jgi:formylglycine-generating enzyme required for sulfatase activity
MEFDTGFRYADLAIQKVRDGEGLRDVERIMLEGSWQEQTYMEIANEGGYTPSYLSRDVGPTLWRDLSQALAMPVNKTNFRIAIERWADQQGMLDISAKAPHTLTLHRYQRTNKRYTEDLGEGLPLPLMLIPAGEFWMGQMEAETAELKQQVSEGDYQRFHARELPRHRVTVPSFFMGKYPVTQAQYAAVMGNNPAEKHDAERFVAPEKPVVEVSWHDAQTFCQRLAERSGKDYRLPSEVEWEYACRAETETPFHFGPTISPELANYDGTRAYGVGPTGEYRRQTTPVGSFPANRWGLCDMHGNVWEWCEDDFHESYEGAPADGRAWVEPDRSTTRRVLRGGSWLSNPRSCRSAYRSNVNADDRSTLIGFRVCCSAPTAL